MDPTILVPSQVKKGYQLREVKKIMSEEEIAAAKAAAEKEAEETTQKIAKLEEEKNNLIGEIKDDRKARQELKEKIEVLEGKIKEPVDTKTVTTEEDKINSVIEKTLASKEASRAKLNKDIAFEKFITENKDFSPDSDPGGLKQSALKDKLERFNTNGLTEVQDFTSVIRDAEALLVNVDTHTKTPTETVVNNPYSSTQKTNITPPVVEDKELEPKELKLIEKEGFTKERFLKLKETNPGFMRQLLGNIS